MVCKELCAGLLMLSLACAEDAGIEPDIEFLPPNPKAGETLTMRDNSRPPAFSAMWTVDSDFVLNIGAPNTTRMVGLYRTAGVHTVTLEARLQSRPTAKVTKTITVGVSDLPQPFDCNGPRAATANDLGSLAWGCDAMATSGTSQSDGQGNTTAATASGCTAAAACDSLVEAGQADWYLPSLDEVKCMFQARDRLELSLSPFAYWSSTEETASTALYQASSTTTLADSKSTMHQVRCVRRR